MAQKISRRTLAKAITAKLTAGEPLAKVAQATAAYLVVHKMTDQLEMLIGDVAYELAQQNRQLFAVVTSAHELSASLKDQLVGFLRQYHTIKNVELAERIDESILGGVIIDTPEETLDASVRSKLRKLASVGD